jgi:hypothetical protein
MSLRVNVVRIDGKNFLMRRMDPVTGRQLEITTGTTSEREARKLAAQHEADPEQH